MDLNKKTSQTVEEAVNDLKKTFLPFKEFFLQSSLYRMLERIMDK